MIRQLTLAEYLVSVAPPASNTTIPEDYTSTPKAFPRPVSYCGYNGPIVARRPTCLYHWNCKGRCRTCRDVCRAPITRRPETVEPLGPRGSRSPALCWHRAGCCKRQTNQTKSVRCDTIAFRLIRQRAPESCRARSLRAIASGFSSPDGAQLPWRNDQRLRTHFRVSGVTPRAGGPRSGSILAGHRDGASCREALPESLIWKEKGWLPVNP